jgi:hypothetical protein
MKDLHNNVKLTRVISPISQSGNAAMVGAIVDRQGFDSLEFAVTLGTITTAGTTYTATMDEGDAANLSDASAVAAADLIGTLALASFVDTEINTTKKVGYKGNKRYVRLTMTPAGNTGASTMAAVAVQGAAMLKPVA